MDKDNNEDDDARVRKPYGGPFLFINKTSETLTRSRDESFTISSHVSKTHRKWLKEEKLRRLHASGSKAVAAQRTILPAATSRIPGVGPSSDASGEGHPGPARAPADPSQLQHDGSASRATARHSAGVRIRGDEHNSQPVYPFEGSQENIDQQRTVPPEAWNRRALAINRPSLGFWKGNSDPFSAAAVSLAAPDHHEIIRLAQRFFVFVAWPEKTNALWRAPIGDTSSSNIHLDQTIADEAEVHALLAAGYAVSGGLSVHDSQSSRSRQLLHKAKAVALLRDRLAKHGFSPSVTTLIRLLISLDFHSSDNESALVHLRGLWAIASTTPGFLPDAQELLLISDAWISIALLKRPEISPERYDPGPRSQHSFDQALQELENKHGIAVTDGAKSATPEAAFDQSMWKILEGAHEIVNTKRIVDEVTDKKLREEVVHWMNRRSSAITAYCTTGYVNATELAQSPELDDAKKVKQTLMAAASLCGMMFMNFKFLDLPHNYNFSRTCQKIEQVLTSVSQALAREIEPAQDADYLWLLLLVAMGNDIFGARGDIPYSSWPATEFHHVCERLGIIVSDQQHQQSVTTILHRYPWYPETDVFLLELLRQKEPRVSIIPWSRWRDILNHP
ncbi:uncharacterized protein Z520_00404 [Fonsecaea multimorphosa CBS 102226]|uniref:Transcription factor domain-containing protein n=1 Tax=Fonsecaea multimorphosa CBS 102226 TaxID=1442371 RepID=A0A0D2KC40_9EURO|nr:uncharacterized protein Z520_00404 [Fonsecaea multimorphosa CBS 102226]KIY03713.1 hypothetical protein Z520_00404 [Fonsecaea multimorphosa CBS 102226]